MPKNDYVYELIQSLNKSEKRYFKLYFATATKTPKHVLLFSILEKESQYDEKKIRQKLTDEYLKKNFAETKYYLYQQILKVLKDYRTENSVDTILIEKTQNIEILLQKALFEQAINELEKAKKMAFEHERFEFLTLLLSYQNKIIVSTRLQGYNNIDLENFWLEKVNVFKNFIDTQTARHKVMQLLESKNRIGYIKTNKDKQFYETIKGEIDNLLNNADCTIAKIYAIESLVFYYNHTDEKKLQNFYCKKLIELHTHNPSINASNPYQLPSAIHNLCLSEINLLNFSEALKWIDIQKKYLEIIHNDIEIKYKVEWSLASLQSYLYNVSGRFQEGKTVVKDIIYWIENTEQIDSRSKWIFYGNCAEIVLGAKDYKQFFYCMRKIREHWVHIDDYNKINYTILQILAHLDEHEIDAVIYLQNALEKEIASVRKGNSTKIETALLQLFQSIKESKKNTSLTKILQAAKQALFENEHEMQMGEFEYALWIEQMLNKNSYENLVRQKRSLQAKDFDQYWNDDYKIQVNINDFRKTLPKRIR
ncbi:MAG TPA: hypothetical protein PK628_05455 [Chitinophagales bacterium]|nr:hypothetical protein [Chitinophagales bacterium]HNF50448.1 hypothetical protein [Chitinophagales bacterium]HNG70504.1 hypothetical protein [Chitinophagales bacterium]HNI32358.1 hypothetical protein [Chitinophagales bacterium]HNO02499.1 hypothetical protein [Chitinophagales bacterium]